MKFPNHVIHRRHRRHRGSRTFMDGAAATTAIKFVRDRGLDHAVEREKNLRPLLSVKNLIKSEPSVKGQWEEGIVGLNPKFHNH
ncbi:hypothetical protein GOBAR_DD30505 [Gossypium barbadense]|nr:hypothetical protein GOBAR_DD30505 [Gossypium barbadense]